MFIQVMKGEVQHRVVVTRMKGHGWGVRLYLDGVLNQQEVAPTQMDIGRIARSMLRMEDKCGNHSDFAHAARHRLGIKELKGRT